MNFKKILLFVLTVLALNCSKKDEVIVDVEDPEFNLELVSFDQNTVNFSYTISTTLENLKLIWNSNETLNLDNNIGDLEVDQASNELFVSNLEQGETYYFRFVGEINNEIFYSEIIQVTLQPEFNIELVSFDQNSVNFSYTLNSNIEDIKLIWNNTNTLDLDNKIGELEVNQDENELTVPNLEPGEVYYFRFVGEFNSEVIYSEIVEVTLLEQFAVTEYTQILTSVSNSYSIQEILKLDDGYLFITGSAILSVSKTTNDFNLLWSFDITDYNEDLFYSGIHKLNENNEYLIFSTGLSGGNSDPYGNSYSPDLRAHEVKFNGDGQIVWNREYSTPPIVDNYYVDSNHGFVKFSKFSENRKVLIVSDSTYYTDNDKYLREFNFDSNGELSSSEIIQIDEVNSENNIFGHEVLLKENNSFLSYGEKDLTPNDGVNARDIIVRKFENNLLVQDYSFGNNGANDFLGSILDEGGNIAIVGTNGHENESDGESRWIFNINPFNGDVIWDIKETEENYSYRGKDLILDTDGNYLSLFFDMYNLQGGTHEYNYATLVKSDSEGNIIWKYVDGEENNDDYFEPERVFKDGNEYVIIGIKSGIWIKRIIVE